MKSLQLVTAAFLFAASTAPAMAQEQANTANSNGSLRPIPQSDQMFRKTIWRSIDLREKQNRPMFSEGKEISRVIIDAVKRGELQAYRNDSLTSTLTAQEMREHTSHEEEMGDAIPGDDAGAWGGSGAAPTSKPAQSNDGWNITPPASAAPRTERRPKKDARGNIMRDKKKKIIYETVTTTAAVKAAPSTNLQAFLPKHIWQIDIKENMIFDKKRSRMYNEIQTVTLFVPATAPGNNKNRDVEIGTFKYSDLVKVFRNNPQTAIWFNAQNDAQHKNLADAFELGLFSSYITKVSNVSDSSLADAYGTPRQGILAAQQTAADLIEYEYSLWSF